MKRVIIIFSILILLLCSNKTKKNIIIPDSAIRVRVIANSNKIEDQVLKLKIKEEVENLLYKEIKDVKTIEEARIKINRNIPRLETNITKTLNSDNYEINYGLNYFPKKEIYGIHYKEGNYESIVIKIGEAKGENWWCVLFPPICMIDVKKEDKNSVVYKSKVLEILNKYN